MKRTSRRRAAASLGLLIGIAAAMGPAAPGRAGTEPGRRPNILFILTDDQPYKTLGCHPEAPRWVRTPHIDRLAARGVRFERAYLGAWCMPARALADAVVPIPADIFGPRPGKPAYLEAVQAWVRGADGRPALRKRDKDAVGFDTDRPGLGHAAWVRQVNECAMAVDDGVGRLLAALEESGQLADTLVVFSSDQGYALGEHGLSSKLAPYDAAIASPLILARPGSLPAGVVRREPVNSPDLTATLCRIAGVDVPWEMHGREFTGLLTDATAAAARPPMLLTSTARAFGADTRFPPAGAATYAHAGVPWWVLLRDGRHKYIRTLVPGEVEEVYDLDTDPEELVNLAVDERHAPLLGRLRDAARAELVRTGAGFAENLPLAATELAAVTPAAP
jgi:arylsulfatase A-like enzyme